MWPPNIQSKALPAEPHPLPQLTPVPVVIADADAAISVEKLMSRMDTLLIHELIKVLLQHWMNSCKQ